MLTEKAKNILPYCGVCRRFQGKPEVIFTPATPDEVTNQPRCANVRVSRAKDLIYVKCETKSVDGDGDPVPCKAHKICYHALAALMFCAGENNLDIEFHEQAPDAYHIKVNNGKSTIYATTKNRSN